MLLLVFGLAGGCGAAPEPPSVHPLAELTGERTRVVWTRQLSGDGDDPLGLRAVHQLWGLDTHDGRGERILLEPMSSYRKPLLSSDGEWIVYSDVIEEAVYRVRWGDSAPRRIADGIAVEVWRDPATGADWVYVGAAVGDRETRDLQPLRRIRLDRPDRAEPVWGGASITQDNFQLSRDGAKAGGLFPWPEAGVLDLPSGRVDRVGRGCWTSFAPDNSYLLWIFDGAHRNVLLRPHGTTLTHRVPINTAPGTEGFEVYHPRWSNHVRYLAITGPYRIQGTHNAITGGGSGMGVYAGRFAEDFQRVEAWAQVTHPDLADFFPDVWIEGGGAADAALAADAASATPPLSEWPGSRDRLVFAWEHARGYRDAADGQGGTLACTVERRGHTRFTRHYQADVRNGGLDTGEAGARIAARSAASGAFTLELTATPLGAPRNPWTPIAVLTAPDGPFAFLLGEKASRLYLHVSTSNLPPEAVQPIQLGSMQRGRPNHIMITYHSGQLAWYLDGQQFGATHDLTGDLSTWPANARFQLGELDGAPDDWQGLLEGVAVYDHALSPQDAAAHAATLQAQWSAHSPAPQLVVDARLDELTPTPDPADIAPYRAGLVEYLYTILETIEGDPPADRILVQHWGILDAQHVPLNRTVGNSYRLSLEAVSDHPELEGERVSSAVTDLSVIDAFLDVDPPATATE